MSKDREKNFLKSFLAFPKIICASPQSCLRQLECGGKIPPMIICLLLISRILYLYFPTFVYKNAYAAIVINGVHFEKAKVPKNSPKICQN